MLFFARSPRVDPELALGCRASTGGRLLRSPRYPQHPKKLSGWLSDLDLAGRRNEKGQVATSLLKQ